MAKLRTGRNKKGRGGKGGERERKKGKERKKQRVEKRDRGKGRKERREIGKKGKKHFYSQIEQSYFQAMEKQSIGNILELNLARLLYSI